MTPEEQLLAAAEDIGKYGHKKGTYFGSPDGWETAPACAMGAIARVANCCIGAHGIVHDRPHDLEASHLLAEKIREKFPHLGGPGRNDVFVTIAMFNDHSRTSAEDVILTMKEAAQR